jgi:CrcB protein
VIQIACAVFIGGGIGSVARWLLSSRFNSASLAIPVGTLIANLTGAFIIGLAFALFSRFSHLDPIWKLLITTGFCGGLTTFSTFSFEVVVLMQEGRFAWAGLNVLINLVGSFLMTAFAFWLVNTVATHQ